MKFMRLTKVGLFLLFGGAFAFQAEALPPAANLRDFEYIKGFDGWLTSYNAAGLLSLPVNNISLVEASFTKNNGGFVNYYQSDNSYDIGIRS